MYITPIENIYNTISLTASEEVDTFEVTKLQDPFGTTRWRSTGLTPYIIFQFGEYDETGTLVAANKTVQSWGPLYTNARDGDTVRLRVATSEANLTASPTYDSGTIDVWPGTGDLSHWLKTLGYVHSRLTVPAASQVSAAWGRIDFDYTGNSDGFVEVGGLGIDTMHQPDKGHQVGWRYLPATRAIFINETAIGGQARGQGSEKRSVGFELQYQTEADIWGQIDAMFRSIGNRLPVLVVLRESENTYPMNYIYYGYMEWQPVGLVKKSAFSVTVQITEP